MRSLLRKCYRQWVLAYCHCLGIHSAIAYLRNPSPSVSVALLKSFCATLGERTTVKRSLLLDNVCEDRDSLGTFEHLEIGANCYIGDAVYFDLANRITIADDAVISGRASFITHADCNRSPFLAERFPRRSARITIGQGAWVGFGAVILHGTTVGNEAVIAAGSLVRHDIPARQLWGGVPARFIRELSDKVCNSPANK